MTGALVVNSYMHNSGKWPNIFETYFPLSKKVDERFTTETCIVEIFYSMKKKSTPQGNTQ